MKARYLAAILAAIFFSAVAEARDGHGGSWRGGFWALWRVWWCW